LHALASGRFGECVYTAGSDVVDNQIVAMELQDGTTAGLVMHGHSAEESRTMRYDGTRGTLRARFGRDTAIEITEHGESPRPIPHAAAAGGHGGGDSGVIRAFLRAVDRGSAADVEVGETLTGHMLGFAAEESRLTGQPIDMARFVEAANGTG